jgi:hypothetical protein
VTWPLHGRRRRTRCVRWCWPDQHRIDDDLIRRVRRRTLPTRSSGRLHARLRRADAESEALGCEERGARRSRSCGVRASDVIVAHLGRVEYLGGPARARRGTHGCGREGTAIGVPASAAELLAVQAADDPCARDAGRTVPRTGDHGSRGPVDSGSGGATRSSRDASPPRRRSSCVGSRNVLRVLERDVLRCLARSCGAAARSSGRPSTGPPARRTVPASARELSMYDAAHVASRSGSGSPGDARRASGADGTQALPVRTPPAPGDDPSGVATRRRRRSPPQVVPLALDPMRR